MSQSCNFTASITVPAGGSDTLSRFVGELIQDGVTFVLPPSGDVDLGDINFVDPEGGEQSFSLLFDDVTIVGINILDEDVVTNAEVTEDGDRLAVEIDAAPIESGSTTVTIQFTTPTGSGVLTISVTVESLAFTPNVLPVLAVDIDMTDIAAREAYDVPTDPSIAYLGEFEDATGEITISSVTGDVPDGCTVEVFNDNELYLTGTPTTDDEFEFTVNITDGDGLHGSTGPLTVTISEQMEVTEDGEPVLVVGELAEDQPMFTVTLPIGTDHESFSYPYGESELGPAGVSFGFETGPGVFTAFGTPDPETEGEYTTDFCIAAKDGGGAVIGACVASKTYTVEPAPVNPFVAVDPPPPFYEDFIVNQNFYAMQSTQWASTRSAIATAPDSEVILPASAAVTSGALPTGMSAEVVDAGGGTVALRLTGIPTESGASFTGVITVTDDESNEFEVPFDVAVYTQAAGALVDPFPSFMVDVDPANEPLTQEGAPSLLPQSFGVIQDGGAVSSLGYFVGSSGMTISTNGTGATLELTANGAPVTGQDGTYDVWIFAWDADDEDIPVSNGKLFGVPATIVIAPA